MSPRHLAALVVCLSLLVAIPVAVNAKTSHAGWQRINGKFRKDSHDRNKTYYGTKRHDELLGGHGNNKLYGGGQADVLWGDYKPSGWPGSQSDHIYGGKGDAFIYAPPTGAAGRRPGQPASTAARPTLPSAPATPSTTSRAGLAPTRSTPTSASA